MPSKLILEIRDKDKNKIDKIIKWLLNHEVSDFSYEFSYPDTGPTYIITVNTTWGHNIEDLAKIIRKYEGKHEI